MSTLPLRRISNIELNQMSINAVRRKYQNDVVAAAYIENCKREADQRKLDAEALAIQVAEQPALLPMFDPEQCTCNAPPHMPPCGYCTSGEYRVD